MPPLPLRRKIAILALAAVLALPWAAAAAPQARHQPAVPAGLVHQLWTALAAFWGAGVILDDGCKMDPSGGCVTGNAVPAPLITPDDGCKMDPNGGCLSGS